MRKIANNIITVDNITDLLMTIKEPKFGITYGIVKEGMYVVFNKNQAKNTTTCTISVTTDENGVMCTQPIACMNEELEMLYAEKVNASTIMMEVIGGQNYAKNRKFVGVAKRNEEDKWSDYMGCYVAFKKAYACIHGENCSYINDILRNLQDAIYIVNTYLTEAKTEMSAITSWGVIGIATAVAKKINGGAN